jgi:coenzyme F420-dependent glucose-6-phosphate dehydrogenase
MNSNCEIGYHASHEQYSPSVFTEHVKLAEQAGFKAINSSDHFHPWSENQGHSGYSFAWLGAAMQATSIPFGSVCAPGQRYHPAIVAQAIATLGEMFPDRYWISLGSGEAINESITGEKWPSKADRNIRLKECFTVIRQLLAGETVNFHGLIHVENAKIYSLPTVIPKLFGAAVSVETAGWMGSFVDGLITVSKPIEELHKVVEAFRAGGGEGKPIYLKTQLSFARTEEEALEGAFHQWKTNILPSNLLSDLHKVSHFTAAASFTKPADLKDMVNISADPQQHINWIKEYQSLGFDRIILHNVNRDQEYFIQEFGEKVLPQFS